MHFKHSGEQVHEERPGCPGSALATANDAVRGQFGSVGVSSATAFNTCAAIGGRPPAAIGGGAPAAKLGQSKRTKQGRPSSKIDGAIFATPAAPKLRPGLRPFRKIQIQRMLEQLEGTEHGPRVIIGHPPPPAPP